MDSKHIFLHVGLHKTGTTSVQSFLLDHRNHLSKRNIFVFQPAYNRHSAIELKAFVGQNLHNDRKIKDWEKLYGLVVNKSFISHTQKRIEKLLSCSGKIIFSSEDLWNCTQEEIIYLKSFFNSHPTTVIICLRDIFSWTASMFSQKMKSQSFSLAQTYKEGHWVNGLQGLLEGALKNYRAIFGKDNVKIIDWNKEIFQRGSVLWSFLEILEEPLHLWKDISGYWSNENKNFFTASFRRKTPSDAQESPLPQSTHKTLDTLENKSQNSCQNTLHAKTPRVSFEGKGLEIFEYKPLNSEDTLPLARAIAQRDQALERLKTIENSFYWRMTFPLRLLVDTCLGKIGSPKHIWGYVKGRLLWSSKKLLFSKKQH